MQNEKLVTAGGRVFGVVGSGKDLSKHFVKHTKPVKKLILRISITEGILEKRG